MSDFNNNSQKQEFIRKLELLRDLEAEKPVEEMDVSLVMACVELILELRGETVNFTPEEVEEKVRKIPFVEETTTLNTPPESVKGRSTKVKSRKILLIAAIISILIAIFAITSIAFEWNIFDELKNRFGTVADTPVNEELEIDGISVYMYGENKDYTSLEEAIEAINLGIVYPTELPNDLVLKKIMLSSFESKEKLVFSFNDTNFTYTILFSEGVSEDIKSVSTDILKIHNFNCYVIDMPDLAQVQICFEYEENLYTLNYNNKQDLIKVIENLKELK
ncbi:MAG: hypothetical protein E7557_09555 [Ruminococcaceae bacterium]|nr:hypothetical protein [Oscillospiraceae bacterium]